MTKVKVTGDRRVTDGVCTVAITNEIFPDDSRHARGPNVLGIRIPMIGMFRQGRTVFQSGREMAAGTTATMVLLAAQP